MPSVFYTAITVTERWADLLRHDSPPDEMIVRQSQHRVKVKLAPAEPPTDWMSGGRHGDGPQSDAWRGVIAEELDTAHHKRLLDIAKRLRPGFGFAELEIRQGHPADVRLKDELFAGPA
jgi:hypothetical protein